MREDEIKLTRQMREDIESSMKTLQMMRTVSGGYMHPDLNNELDKSEQKMKSLLKDKKSEVFLMLVSLLLLWSFIFPCINLLASPFNIRSNAKRFLS